jgi:hypothetical protein
VSYSAADLALTAARTRLLAERLSDGDRDELIADWSQMLDELDNPRSNREITLLTFRAEIERRLRLRPVPASSFRAGGGAKQLSRINSNTERKRP